MEEVQGERAELPEKQETTPTNEVREEVKDVEGDLGGARVFLTDKGQRFSGRLSPRKDLSMRRNSKSWCRPSRKRLREGARRCSTNTWSQTEELSSNSSMRTWERGRT